MNFDVPVFGNVIVCAILVAAGATFSVSLAAARNRPHLVPVARYGMFATIALITSAVFLLAYAFQAHDFRIRYVAHYSDRSMPAVYLWTALWGGQDGSLLWWSFLLAGYSLAFTAWVKNRYLELQPWVYATLSTIFAFFAVLMLFAANPFATTYGAAPADGEGLNPLLQNYWMAIHPPALYMGLTGWAVPFGIVVAALMTGRLGDEWILMARRWVLLAWGFLSLGNTLGMFWSYEELGWGGYWAWDPVENASFMPWLLATGYLHSVMIQERRGMMKVWNVSLLAGTFWLTIFGTFLTRSGLIASVHSFARSDIGIYFVWFMIALLVFIVTMIAWRLPELRARKVGVDDLFAWTIVSGFLGALAGFVSGYGAFGALIVAIGPVLIGYAWAIERLRERLRAPSFGERRPGTIDSLLSREFAFLLNNWIFAGMLLFVMIATTFPLLSETLRGQTVTVGPLHYHQWMVPMGIILLFLTGVGPLIAWRKASGRNLLLAFRAPLAFSALVLTLHCAVGPSFGLPPIVAAEPIYPSLAGRILAHIYSLGPVASTATCAFVLAAIVQEFGRGTRVRMKNSKEGVLRALSSLVFRARRRYGGYIVHLGIVFAYLGFTGAAYDAEREGAVLPGSTLEVGGYSFRYEGSRQEVDLNKQMTIADVIVLRDGEAIGRVQPARFIYRSHPEMPTTEVAIRSTPLNDLYVILSAVDLETHRGTLKVIVRPLVWWIWFGAFVVLLGVFVAAFPTLSEILGEAEERPRMVRPALTAAALLLASVVLPNAAHAQADSTSSLHAGHVELSSPIERQLFERLLCLCGGCQRLPLTSCVCGWAEDMRNELRAALAGGSSPEQIQIDYRARFGPQALAIPGDSGLDRALWAVPIATLVAALGGVVVLGRRWSTRKVAREPSSKIDPRQSGALDQQLEDELRSFEES